MSITFSSVPRLDDPPRRIRLNPSGNSQATPPVQNNSSNVQNENKDKFLQGLKAAENAEKQAVGAVSGMTKVGTWQGQNVYKATSAYNPETLKTEDRYFVYTDVIVQYKDGQYKIVDQKDFDPANCWVEKQFVMVKKLGDGNYQIVDKKQYHYSPDGLQKCVTNAKQQAESQKCEDFDVREFRVSTFGASNKQRYCEIWNIDKNNVVDGGIKKEISDAPFKDIRKYVINYFAGFVDKLVKAIVDAGKCTRDMANLAGKTLIEYFTTVMDTLISDTTDDSGNCVESQAGMFCNDIMYKNYVQTDAEGNTASVYNDVGAVEYISSTSQCDVSNRQSGHKFKDNKELQQELANGIESNGIFVGCDRTGKDRYNIFIDVQRMIELFKHFCGVD